MKYLYSTASKQPERFPDNYPRWATKGEGAYIYDENGKKYLDFCCSLGPIILGWKYPVVDEAVIRAIKDEGTIFSLQHPKERILADLLCEMIPSAEMVKFAHNGKDVTEAAVRLARYITGRDLVVSFSYHGATDVFMAATHADKGVPQELKKLITEVEYNDLERLTDLFDKYKPACFILEPHTIQPQKGNYLKLVRELCNKHEVILIFDEVVSFPRYPKYSAQAHYGVTPDLTCVSKGMANGYPISALVGKEKYMKEFKDGGVFMSTTFGGNLIGVSAAIATLQEVIDKDVPSSLGYLGSQFKKGLKGVVELKGSRSCRQFLGCDDITRIKIWQEAIKKNIFFHVPIFFNYSMTEEDIKKTVKVVKSIMKRIDKIKIKGKMPGVVFKKK